MPFVDWDWQIQRFRATIPSMLTHRILLAAFGVSSIAISPAMPAMAEAPAMSSPAPSDARTRMPDLPPAEIDNALAIGGEDIKARKLSTRMTVSVEVNEKGPYRFVVDSGADTSVVGRRIAQALGLPPTTPVVLNGITESRMVDRVTLDSLTVGPTSIENLRVPVLAEEDLGAEGMLGLDALVEQRLVLDFEKRTIAVDDARRSAPAYDGEIVVTARLKRGQLILTSVKAGNVGLDAIIDTGSEVTIGNVALRDRLFRRYPKKFETIEVAGVTGAISKLELIRVPELKLGPVTLQDVPIAFADVPPFKVFGIHDKPALLLGTDLMESFRKVSLDFRARKVRFQLRRCNTMYISVVTTSVTATRLVADPATPAVCLR